MKKRIFSILPFLIIVLIVAGFYLSDVSKLFSFETLQKHHHLLKDFTEVHPIGAPVLYIGIYFIATLLSLPLSIFLNIIAGLFFHQPFSTIYAVIGATLGATALFVIAKTAFGNLLQKKAGSRIKKMEKGFQKNAVQYLIFLRLLIVVPFSVVNLAPAIFGIRLRVFFWTTLFGIIPVAFVFTQTGRGLSTIFETQGKVTLSAILNNHVIIAMVTLAILAILALILKNKHK